MNREELIFFVGERMASEVGLETKVGEMALTAIDAAGWTVVPKEPTEEMIKATKPHFVEIDNILSLHQIRTRQFLKPKEGKSALHHAYKAMIAASPAAKE